MIVVILMIVVKLIVEVAVVDACLYVRVRCPASPLTLSAPNLTTRLLIFCPVAHLRPCTHHHPNAITNTWY